MKGRQIPAPPCQTHCAALRTAWAGSVRALPQRRGAVLVVMLVLLAVVMLFTAGWAGHIVGDRQQVRRQFIVMQAIRLAESGLARGEARLEDDPKFAGEVWEISAESWEAKHAARVQITVEPEVPKPGWARITARATYPLDHELAVNRTRSAVIAMPATINESE